VATAAPLRHIKHYPTVSNAKGLLNSGAFSDAIEQRVTPDKALIRQLDWEIRASKNLGASWICQAIATPATKSKVRGSKHTCSREYSLPCKSLSIFDCSFVRLIVWQGIGAIALP
jgi:hypothetical protein